MMQSNLTPTSEAVRAQASPFIWIAPWHRYLIAGILGSFLVTLGWQQIQQPANVAGMGWVFLALVVNFALYLVPLIFYQPTFGWLHPLVFSTVFAFLNHLRRFDLYINGLQWHGALPGWSSDSLTQILIWELALGCVACMAYYLGFFFGPTFKVPQLRFYRPQHLAAKVMLTVFFSATVFTIYMQIRGGIVNHLLSWGKGRNEALAGEFYWQFFTRFGLVACLSWLTMDRTSTSRPLFWLCTALSLTMTFLSGGSRSSVIYFMVMGLLAWLLRERKIDLIRILLIAAAGFLMLVVLGNLRDSTYEGAIDWSTLLGGMPQGSTTDESAFGAGMSEISQRSGVFSGVFPILALVPQQVDYLYGKSYLALLTLPIPKGLWADKPGLIAGLVGQTFFNTNIGMPPGAIGEAYWNFGLPGVLMVFFLFGLFTKWMTDVFLKYAHQPAAVVVYTLTLFLLAEPSGLNIISWILMMIPAVLLLLGIGAIKIKPSSVLRLIE